MSGEKAKSKGPLKQKRPAAQAAAIVSVPRVALSLGVICVICTIAIAVSSFNVAMNVAEANAVQLYLLKAEMLVVAASNHPQDSDTDLLLHIQEVWNPSGDHPEDEYVCVTNINSELILHTAVPQSIGNYVGENKLTSESPRELTCLDDLAQSRTNYVGGYISSTGEDQIAAFCYLPDRDWLIGIHRSKAAIQSEILMAKLPLLLGFAAVCLLLPLSLFLLYRAYSIEQQKKSFSSAALRASEESMRWLRMQQTSEAGTGTS